MAKSVVRKWNVLRSAPFGGGRLMIVAWHASDRLQKYAALVIQREDNGGIPAFPEIIFGGQPGYWRAVRIAFRRMVGLSGDIQLVLSRTLLKLGSVEGLDEAIEEAQAQVTGRRDADFPIGDSYGDDGIATISEEDREECGERFFSASTEISQVQMIQEDPTGNGDEPSWTFIQDFMSVVAIRRQSFVGDDEADLLGQLGRIFPGVIIANLRKVDDDIWRCELAPR